MSDTKRTRMNVGTIEFIALAIILMIMIGVGLMIMVDNADAADGRLQETMPAVCTDAAGRSMGDVMAMVEDGVPHTFSFERNGVPVIIKSPAAEYDGGASIAKEYASFIAFHMYDCKLAEGATE